MEGNIMSIVKIENRKARHDYEILETLECGLVLRGNEVKSIRGGMASIKESWISVNNKEMEIKGMHITPWGTANSYDVDEKRDKKLLAHRSEIVKLGDRAKQDGLTIIPLKVYFNNKGKCKIQIGLCRGKKNYDKRQSSKERTANMDIKRELSNRYN